MQQILYITAIGCLLAACNNPGDKLNSPVDSTGTVLSIDSGRMSAATTPTAGAVGDTSIAGCYAFASGRDTVLLQLERKADNVNGSLSYNYFEKDRNDGTLQGSITGDRISGFYLFKSEGIMSVRQEIWKIGNGQLTPGMGEMIQRNDSMFFKDPLKVKFDDSRALTKTLCTT